MKLNNILIIVFFLTSLAINAQNFRVTKILSSNLFELDNNQKVTFYGLYIPSEQDTNQSLSELSKDILKWENDFILDRNFKFDFISKNEDGIYSAVIYRSYAFSDENMANRLLSLGYASLLKETEKDYYNQLISYQEHAQKEGVGIWKNNMAILQNIDTSILNFDEKIFPFQKKYSKPYLPLLAVSLASFALAWDSFSSASDIQESIDLFKKFDKNFDTSKLESSKTRKSVVGVTCVVAGFVTAFFSFQSVHVKTNLRSVSLSYRF